MVLRRQMGTENGNPAEMELPRLQMSEDHRMSADGADRSDSVIGAGLGEVKYLGAVAEHRGAGLPQVQLTRVDFCEMRNEVRLQMLIRCDEVFQLMNEFLIGKIAERKTGGLGR